MTQCNRNGYAFSSWMWRVGDDYEEYALAVPGYYTNTKRTYDNADANDFPVGASFEEVKTLPDGAYNINGTVVEITFEDTLLNLPTGGVISNETYTGPDAESYLSRRGDKEGLRTTYGTTPHWNTQHIVDIDLADVIAAGLAKFIADRKESNTLSKRGEVCQIRGDNWNQRQWVVSHMGEWSQPWRRASGCKDYGEHNPGWYGVEDSYTITESFSLGFDLGMGYAIAEAAVSLGYTWERSYTQGTSTGCWWNHGTFNGKRTCETDRQAFATSSGLSSTCTGSEAF